MSAILAPTGLRPIGSKGHGPYEGGFSTYPLLTNNAAALAPGDLVAIVAGTIASVAASPAAGTLSANTPVGIFMGVSYNDPYRGFVNSEILAANAVTLGYTNIQVKVVDAPGVRMTVQADGPIAATAIGAEISLTNFGASDLVVKTSRVRALASSLSSASAVLALKIVGFENLPDNAAGDAFTRLIVQFNANVHYWDVAGAH